MGIYIANISYRAKEADLKKLFEPYGAVRKVTILTNQETGTSRGIGFVNMEDQANEQKAIAALDGFEFMERPLTVNVAKERKQNYNR